MSARLRTSDAANPSRLLRPEEAAIYFNLSLNAFERLVADGDLPAPIRLSPRSTVRLWDPRDLDIAAARAADMARLVKTVKCASRSGAQTYVYFVVAGETVKIGFSKEPMRRIESLKTGIAEDITAFFCIRAPQSLEGQLHQFLATERMNGEWFRMSSKTKSVIAKALVGQIREAS